MWISWMIAAALAVPPVEPPPTETSASWLLGSTLSSSHGYDTLRTLCDDYGARLSGSAILEEAIDWSAGELKSYGLDVRLEEVLVPAWSRGEESARLLSPQKREMTILGLGNTVGTSKKGIQGEVLVMNNFAALEALSTEDVAGKIVLWNVPFTNYGETVAYRTKGASAAARKGAIASLVRSVTPESLSTPHTGVQRYAEDVTPIPAMAITLEDAETMQRWTDAGKHIELKLTMGARQGRDQMSANVIAELKGREKPEEVVLMGCHIDSWDVGQGAQDDGAGCIMVMEAARQMAMLPVRPRRTVRVVLFTNEENGLAGGKHYAKHHADEKHVMVLEADSGSGAPLGFRVDVRRGDGAPVVEALKPFAELLAPLSAQRLELRGSGADIGPLIDATGVLGLGLMNDLTDYWPIHHTDADTFDKIDPKLLAENTATVAVMAWQFADAKVIPATNAGP
jgi:hypothetical protein